jgi:hypothetical protein
MARDPLDRSSPLISAPFDKPLTSKPTPHPPPPTPQAYQYYKAGAQYIVREGQVVIVDESTGRVKPISRYQVRGRGRGGGVLGVGGLEGWRVGGLGGWGGGVN